MMELKAIVSGYEAEFEQVAGGSWSATVPSLPTIATCGETLDETKAMVAEAIELWIEVAKEKGERIPAPS